MYNRGLKYLSVLAFIFFSVNVYGVVNGKVASVETADADSASAMLPEKEWLKDPTQPFEWSKPRSTSKAKRTYKLNYLLYASERKQAIINGKTVNVGDRVHGAKVLKITERSVLLSVEGGTKVLRWKQPTSIKRTR